MFAFLNKKNLRQYIYKVNDLLFYIYISHSFLYLSDNVMEGDHIFVQRNENKPTLWPVKENICVHLLQNIIHSSGAVQDEMAHYLYVLQSVTLNHLEPRMRTPLDCYSQVSQTEKHLLLVNIFLTECRY